jgi:Skp family chaperone for outer membrane proteins
MARWSVLAVGAAVVVGVAFVAGASVPPKPSESQIKQDNIKTIPITSQKIGFFNMVKVMMESKRALTSLQRLNDRKARLSKNLVGMRGMYSELKTLQLQSNQKNQNPTRHEQMNYDIVLLGRRIEDMDLEINKLINNQASIVISELYDDIYAATVEVAHERGLSVVLAYPDAATPEERDNPQMKELKLKPGAAQPFYIEPSVDYTDDLIERLNAKFANETGDH